MEREKNNFRESCFTPFPVMFICTLKGFSGTQENPAKFTAKNLQCTPMQSEYKQLCVFVNTSD